MSEIVGILQQLLERAQTEQLVEHVEDERLALDQAEGRLLLFPLEHRRDQLAQLRLGLLALHLGEPFEIQAVQQLLVNAALQGLVLGVRVSAARGGEGKCVQHDVNSISRLRLRQAAEQTAASGLFLLGELACQPAGRRTS